MSNKIAAIFLGVYLLRVFTLGRSNALIENLKQEKDFLVWFLALLILLAIRESLPSKDVGNSLITLAFVGMGLQAAGNGKLEQAFSSLIKP